MSNHTPGQWETSRDAVPEGHVQITVYATDTGRRVATAFEHEGNARLIAAAPALLAKAHALLDALYKEYPEGLPFYCRDAATEMLTACDQAEGRDHQRSIGDQLIDAYGIE